MPTYVEGKKCGKNAATRATHVCKVVEQERSVWHCIPGASPTAVPLPLGCEGSACSGSRDMCECDELKKEFMVFTKWEEIDEKACE